MVSEKFEAFLPLTGDELDFIRQQLLTFRKGSQRLVLLDRNLQGTKPSRQSRRKFLFVFIA
jgi:hypothetical protein